MDNPIIFTHALTKRYDHQHEVYAIRDLELQVPKGILYGLIGPDGAGKSTTLRILATIFPASSGEVLIAGFDVVKHAENIRTQIGYMPQNFSLYLDLSVIENLSFFADLQQVHSFERGARIEKMLNFTRLKDFQHRRARDLSGGMKKKLALACAMIHNPQILILDEPSTGVDPVSRRELWAILAEVVRDGVTVIVSTPYMDEAERCHTVAIMHHGKIIANGSPAALRASLPFDVIEVKAKPRKETRQLISRMTGINDWRPVGDRFRLSVEKNGITERLEQIKAEMEGQNLDVRILRQTSPSMEDVFIYQAENSRGSHE
jgi:ABC-2 type transport system ATP-binding protein